MEALSFYRTLRGNPPPEIRQTFFPKSRAEIKAITRSGPGIYRPVLKTDQGPGQFTAFKISSNVIGVSAIRKRGNEGYAMVEHHFGTQLDHINVLNVLAGNSIFTEMNLVRENYRLDELNEAFLALERLEMACDESGVNYKRDAKVGREGFFFIRPMVTEEKVVLPRSIAGKVEGLAQKQKSEFIKLALEEAERYSIAMGLKFSIGPQDINLPFYYHLDAQVFPTGEVILDQIQLPDVGLFLTKLDPDNNQTLSGIQTTISSLKPEIMNHVVASLLDHPNFDGKVALVTRKEVIDECEDTLEILELQVVGEELRKRGIDSQVVSAEEAARVESGIGLLFNIDPDSQEFRCLMESRIRNGNKLHLFPDPLLKSAESRMTGLRNTLLKGRDLENFHSLVSEIDQDPERVYRQLISVDSFLNSLGIEEEVLHFYIPGQATPAAAFRGDVGSFHQVSNMVKGTKESVTVRQIPIDPKRAVLFDQNGAIYNVFRFTVLGGGYEVC